jgi:O-acetyl-ADP-ribose deacetylase (regulator of RNase III)
MMSVDINVKPHEEVTPSSSPSYREVHGDIFTSDAEGIVNTVNSIGAMGKGIALEFKKRYPDLYIAYRQACARKEIQPGYVWVYQAKERIIFNAAVKDDWRDTSGIVWVESCLQELIGCCRTMKVKSLALPWMGAMNGRIPVDEIKASTRKILSGIIDFEISVYEIRKNI